MKKIVLLMSLAFMVANSVFAQGSYADSLLTAVEGMDEAAVKRTLNAALDTLRAQGAKMERGTSAHDVNLAERAKLVSYLDILDGGDGQKAEPTRGKRNGQSQGYNPNRLKTPKSCSQKRRAQRRHGVRGLVH